MSNTNLKYRVDGQQIDGYLKKVFISRATTFVIVIAVVMTMFTFIIYKQDSEFPIWILILAVAIVVVAFLFGMKLWNDNLRKIANTEFILTNEGIIQSTQNNVERDFKFTEIAVIKKMKLGTTIVKGNLLTKIDFYRPKRVSPYQLGDPTTIFIPNITTNYSELIDNIRQAKRLT
jgi:hypothetical protein